VSVTLVSAPQSLSSYPPPISLVLYRTEFLLSNAIDGEDYARAEEEVRKLGLDPATIPHRGP